MNNKRLAQIMAYLLVTGALGGIIIFTDTYQEVQSNIVSILCLSCTKLEPVTEADFTFETANGELHSSFVLDNLSKGPVFLHYSEDVCAACDIMLPVILDLFNITYQKEDFFSDTVSYQNVSFTVIYLNFDHAPDWMTDSFYIYDKEHIEGLPMFSIITLGYDRGVVRPYYTSLYGTLAKDNNAERLSYLQDVIQNSITLYQQNRDGYR